MPKMSSFLCFVIAFVVCSTAFLAQAKQPSSSFSVAHFTKTHNIMTTTLKVKDLDALRKYAISKGYSITFPASTVQDIDKIRQCRVQRGTCRPSEQVRENIFPLYIEGTKSVSDYRSYLQFMANIASLREGKTPVYCVKNTIGTCQIMRRFPFPGEVQARSEANGYRLLALKEVGQLIRSLSAPAYENSGEIQRAGHLFELFDDSKKMIKYVWGGSELKPKVVTVSNNDFSPGKQTEALLSARFVVQKDKNMFRKTR